jgi:hypothetical protein
LKRLFTPAFVRSVDELIDIALEALPSPGDKAS